MKGQEVKHIKPMELRERAGLTQRQVAVALDVREATVSGWERGKSSLKLSPSRMKQLLNLYGCTLDELIEAFDGSRLASE